MGSLLYRTMGWPRLAACRFQSIMLPVNVTIYPGHLISEPLADYSQQNVVIIDTALNHLKNKPPVGHDEKH